MWILIDRERMCITHKHVRLDAITNVAHIEMAHCSTVICDDMDSTTFEDMTDLELKMLYENMCGQKYQGFSRKDLVDWVRAISFSLYESKIDGFEAAKQAMAIPMDDDGFYKYEPGADKATPVQDLYVPKPLRGNANPNGPLPYVPVQTAPPATPMRAPAAPKTSEPGTAPKHGSKTGQVWIIADSIYQPGMDKKMLRAKIIAECEAQGINSSTAGVQYSKWAKAKLE